MAISFSKDVMIKPGVLAANGSGIDVNSTVISSHPLAPNGVAQVHTSYESVGQYYGTSSALYQAAINYFKGYKGASITPGQLIIWSYPQVDTYAFLRSANLVGSLTLSTLKTLSGTLDITVDGTAINANVDFSTATSFANAATLLGNALGSAVNVTYNTDGNAFIIQVNTSTSVRPEDSVITFASGTLASSLYLTQAKGATVSAGATASVTVNDCLDNLKNATQNWALYTTDFEANIAQHLAFAKWANDSNDRYAYVGWSNPDGQIQSYDYLAQVINSSYDGTVGVYGSLNEAMCPLSFAACLNFDQLKGRRSFKYREFDNITPLATTDSMHDQLTAAGYNFYGQYSENNLTEKYWAQGSITGDYAWIDAWVGQVWLNANLKQAGIQLLKSDQYLPYGDSGRVAIEAALTQIVEKFKNWGGITIGTELDENQILSIINTVGVDITSTLSNRGYYIYVGPFTSSMRANRTTPEIYLWYTDGSVIQQLYINSVEVQ